MALNTAHQRVTHSQRTQTVRPARGRGAGRATASALLTFRDYGLGWDDYTHSEYGELLLAF